MGKESVTQRREKKKIQATRNTCLVAHISSFLWREEATKTKATRWKHSFSSYYLSPYTVTFVLLFWSRNWMHTLVAIMKPCQLAIFFKNEGENGSKWNTHTWYWRRRWWSGAPLPWPCFVRRTQSFQRPAADPRRWTWGCCPPGSASRHFPGAGRCEASRSWCQPDRWPRSVAWRCGRARHPGTWAPWWTGWQQPGWTELEGERGKEGK